MTEHQKGLRAAWDAVNAIIQVGELQYPQHEQRNGMVLAANAIAALMGWPVAKYAEELEGAHTTWRNVGEDEITATFDAMPNGRNGFLKTWGYATFARAIEAKVRELNDPNRDPNF